VDLSFELDDRHGLASVDGVRRRGAVRLTDEFEPALAELVRCFRARPFVSLLYCAAAVVPDATAAARAWHARPRGQGDVLAWLLGTDGSIAGAVRVESSELSYFIVPALQGLGLGRQALRAVLRDRAPCLQSIRAVTERANVRSRRLLERTGFGFGGAMPGARGQLLVYRRDFPAPDPRSTLAAAQAEPPILSPTTACSSLDARE
jgi:GNAT superfamily N-acetyltransferase